MTQLGAEVTRGDTRGDTAGGDTGGDMWGEDRGDMWGDTQLEVTQLDTEVTLGVTHSQR